MLQSAVDNCTDVVVCKTVINGLSLAAELNKPRALEDPQLMGNGGLCYGKHFRNMLNAHFSLKENVENFDPGGISENLVKLGKVVKNLVAGQNVVFNVAVVCHKHLNI